MRLPSDLNRTGDYSMRDAEWSQRFFEAAPSELSTLTIQIPVQSITVRHPTIAYFRLVPTLVDGAVFCRFTQLEHLTLGGTFVNEALDPSVIHSCLASLPMLRSLTLRGSFRKAPGEVSSTSAFRRLDIC